MERLGQLDPGMLAIICITATLIILALLCLSSFVGPKPLDRRKAKTDRD